MPKRIQLRRTKGWRLPPGVANVARPTRWGNPYKVMDDPAALIQTPHEAVETYRIMVEGGHGLKGGWIKKNLHRLRGKDLACWCPLTYPGGRPHPCHADVLLELANKEEPDGE